MIQFKVGFFLFLSPNILRACCIGRMAFIVFFNQTSAKVLMASRRVVLGTAIILKYVPINNEYMFSHFRNSFSDCIQSVMLHAIPYLGSLDWHFSPEGASRYQHGH